MPPPRARNCARAVGWLLCAAAFAPGVVRSAPPDPTGSPHDFSSRLSPETVLEVTANLEVGGEIKVPDADKIHRLPISVAGTFRYAECRFEAGSDWRSIRHYDQAVASIKVDRDGTRSRLSPERSLIIATWNRKGPVGFQSCQGPLTREELDLVDTLANSLVLEALLPSAPVRIGQRWDHSSEVIGALLGLSAVSQCDVDSLLLDVQDGVARMAIGGRVEGSAEGVTAQIQLKGRYDFDMPRGHVTRMDLAAEEDRAIGHIGPGLDVTARIKLARTPVAGSEPIEQFLQARGEEASPMADDLSFTSSTAGFAMTYDRRWFITQSRRDLVVLRRVDQGKLVAQCNVSPLPSKSPSRPVSLSQFQKDVRFSLNDRFERFVSASQYRNSAGHRVYRVVAQGAVDRLPVEWRYYLVTDDRGRRLALAFTVERALSSQLGNSDRKLVEALTFSNAVGAAEITSADRPPAADSVPPR